MSLLISVSELRSLINDKSEKLLLVDTRPFSEYTVGHIPTAVNVDLFQFHWIDTSRPGIKDFERQSKILLSNLGVKEGQRVVFYDKISGMASARGVWLLLYFSRKNVQMLDSGFDGWQKGKYPTETKTNALVHSNFMGTADHKILATLAEVKKTLRKKDTVMIDARTKEEFTGKYVRAARAGHIPLAININWEQNVKNGSFKNLELLSKLYSRIPKDSKIVTYCQGGYRAAHTFVALKLLGYKDVKMYLGSWGEWGNRLDLPVEI